MSLIVAALALSSSLLSPVENLSVEQLNTSLKNLGYTVSFDDLASGLELISKDGIQASCLLERNIGMRGPVGVMGLKLIRRYQLDQPLNSAALNDKSESPRDSGVTYSHYLDHTLVAEKSITLVPAFNEARLQGELTAYWDAMTSLQKLLPKNGWKTVAPGAPVDAPLDENATLDRALGEDFAFLVKKWGWTYTGPNAGNSFTWWDVASVDGNRVDLRGVIENGQIDPFKFSIDVSLQNVKFTDPKVQDSLKNLDWASVTFGDQGFARVRTDVDLRKGMTVKLLKKRITDFVRKASSLAK